MRATSIHVLLVTLLVAGLTPLGTAASVSADLDATDADPQVALPCLFGLLFCTQCNDGVDNDGDGTFDYPNDPSCDSSSDNDEYSCYREPVYASITSVGPKYDTDVSISAELVYSCPGGARFELGDRNCAPYNPDWIETSCTSWVPAGTRGYGGSGTYSCGGGSCSTGTISPHNLRVAFIILDDFGSWTCAYQSTTGVPVTTSCI